jgi:hypothetical protein
MSLLVQREFGGGRGGAELVGRARCGGRRSAGGVRRSRRQERVLVPFGGGHGMVRC